MNKKNKLKFHPGIYIKDELISRDRSQKKFAEIIGKSTKEVSELINGKIKVTPQRAILIATAFGTSEITRLNLQQKFDLSVAKENFPTQRLNSILQKIKHLQTSPQITGTNTKTL